MLLYQVLLLIQDLVYQNVVICVHLIQVIPVNSLHLRRCGQGWQVVQVFHHHHRADLVRVTQSLVEVLECVWTQRLLNQVLSLSKSGLEVLVNWLVFNDLSPLVRILHVVWELISIHLSMVDNIHLRLHVLLIKVNTTPTWLNSIPVSHSRVTSIVYL